MAEQKIPAKAEKVKPQVGETWQHLGNFIEMEVTMANERWIQLRLIEGDNEEIMTWCGSPETFLARWIRVKEAG